MLNPWRPIKTFRGHDYKQVDLWLHIYASPLSMGMSDSFRIVDAYRKNGKWFHLDKSEERELASEYITHWAPIPNPPKRSK
jgi:hypothetical protein